MVCELPVPVSDNGICGILFKAQSHPLRMVIAAEGSEKLRASLMLIPRPTMREENS